MPSHRVRYSHAFTTDKIIGSHPSNRRSVRVWVCGAAQAGGVGRGRVVTGTTRAILVQTMVDAQTLTEHLIDLDTLAASRSRGSYLALCGTEVLAASMTTEEQRFCKACLRRQVDRCC